MNNSEQITALVAICKDCNEIRRSIVKQTSTPERIDRFKSMSVDDNIREIPLLSLAKFPLRCKCNRK